MSGAIFIPTMNRAAAGKEVNTAAGALVSLFLQEEEGPQ